MADRSALKALFAAVPRKTIGSVAIFALATSLTEGIGLIMLVPLLQLLSDTQGPHFVTRLLAALHLPLRLDLLLAIFVILLVLRALVVQLRSLSEARLEFVTTDTLRSQLFGALVRANWRYLVRLRGGDLLGTVHDAIDRTGYGLHAILSLATGCVTLLVILGAAVLIAPMPSLAMGAAGAAILLVYSALRRRASQEGLALTRANARAYGFYSERLNALRVIKSFRKEGVEDASAREIAGDVTKIRLDYQKGLGLGQFALQALAAVLLGTAVWGLHVLWKMPLAIILPLVALFARSIPLLGMVQLSWQQWAFSRPAVIEVASLIEEASQEGEEHLPGAKPIAVERGIVLEDVSVVYAGRERPALDHVTLDIPAKSAVLVTGPSGAGKSTLADILAGLIHPDEGRISVDGHRLEHSEFANWRASVSYVQQESLLFDASVRENLLWAVPGATEAELEAALRKASADFVLASPAGLETQVGAIGRRLSGGERQRIALARALLRQPSLLVLDEATSSLDRANTETIIAALEKLKGEVTMLIVSHTDALARIVDRTIVLEEGRVNGQG
jgi:ATP-binding cassette subfamily C protein